jgi:hypothetical protein
VSASEGWAPAAQAGRTGGPISREDETVTIALAAPVGTAFARLDRWDRCDRCGVQAQVRAVLPSGDLLFCGHHARQHAEALARVAVLVDSSHRAA